MPILRCCLFVWLSNDDDDNDESKGKYLQRLSFEHPLSLSITIVWLKLIEIQSSGPSLFQTCTHTQTHTQSQVGVTECQHYEIIFRARSHWRQKKRLGSDFYFVICGWRLLPQRKYLVSRKCSLETFFCGNKVDH